MWQCPKCQTHNQGKFCPKCGFAGPSDTKENLQGTGQPNTKKKSNTGLKVLSIILIVLALVAVLFTANFLIQKNKEESESTQQAIAKTSKQTEAPTPAPQPDEETEAAYGVYRNSAYNFYCAYPADFISTSPKGINALKSYESVDGTAVMTIRANKDTSGITIEEAMEDFCRAYGGTVGYQAKGDTWYAISVTNEGRMFYRKFFSAQGNIYCMDFEFNEEDLQIYSPHIEYIEDNFKVNK